jgi:5-methylcytosine-specific restriction endonuclease McrA
MIVFAISDWLCWMPVGLFVLVWISAWLLEARERAKKKEVERLAQAAATREREFQEALVTKEEADLAAADVLRAAQEHCNALFATARRAHPLIKFGPPVFEHRLEAIIAESFRQHCKRRELDIKKAESNSAISTGYLRQLCSAFKSHHCQLLVREIAAGSHGPEDFWENEERYRKTTKGTQAKDWGLRRYAVHSRDHGICLRCGVRVSVEKCHIHHMTKSSRGGSNALDNLATLCRDCHCMMPGHEHMRVRFSYVMFEGAPHRKSCSALPKRMVTVKKPVWNRRQRRWGKRRRNVEMLRVDLEGLETFPFNIAIERGHQTACPLCKPDEQYERLLANWLPSSLRAS